MDEKKRKHKERKKRNNKKYRERHKEHIKKIKRKYYINNRLRETTRSFEWRQSNSEIIECECGKTYKKYNKTTHLKTKFHCEFVGVQYLTPKYHERIICECGGSYLRKSIKRHLNTKKHLNYIYGILKEKSDDDEELFKFSL